MLRAFNQMSYKPTKSGYTVALVTLSKNTKTSKFNVCPQNTKSGIAQNININVKYSILNRFISSKWILKLKYLYRNIRINHYNNHKIIIYLQCLNTEEFSRPTGISTLKRDKSFSFRHTRFDTFNYIISHLYHKLYFLIPSKNRSIYV